MAKPVVKASEMDPSMLEKVLNETQYALENTTKYALENITSEQAVAKHLKKQFEDAYDPTW
eukprot:CAMPEP_0194508224 /NCGR_PEP_ID=MMETSP0253-20130528/38198_1 /TAXON_ID=2966 /ORGANISM="Noctiluca scintillans" /LENGTH=60 /DNA_ID=CAMNT_0039351221 /DNA_START=25 /DNA_END=204 /DNA_ORIENTATION=+